MEPGKLRHSQEMRHHVASEIKHERPGAWLQSALIQVTPKPVNQQYQELTLFPLNLMSRLIVHK